MKSSSAVGSTLVTSRRQLDFNTLKAIIEYYTRPDYYACSIRDRSCHGASLALSQWYLREILFIGKTLKGRTHRLFSSTVRSTLLGSDFDLFFVSLASQCWPLNFKCYIEDKAISWTGGTPGCLSTQQCALLSPLLVARTTRLRACLLVVD